MSVFRSSRCYGVQKGNASGRYTLDKLPDDLSVENVPGDHWLDARGVEPIIQSGGSARGRHGRKAGPHHCAWLWAHDLANEDVRALGATAEAALPGELGDLASSVRRDRIHEDAVKGLRAALPSTLGSSADDDPVAAFGQVVRA